MPEQSNKNKAARKEQQQLKNHQYQYQIT